MNLFKITISKLDTLNTIELYTPSFAYLKVTTLHYITYYNG